LLFSILADLPDCGADHQKDDKQDKPLAETETGGLLWLRLGSPWGLGGRGNPRFLFADGG
jgi:hypothetical protein